MTDLWVEATHDFDREENDRQLIAAREAVVDLWQFLASAVNTDDFENRKALISDRLDQAAQGETRQRLEAALDRDFEVVLSQRPKGRKAAYDEFGDWSYEDAQAVITKLKAVDGYDEPAILAAIQGIGYDTFQVLDEKPGYFGNYYDEDWHWKLRRARNSAEGFFDAIGPRNSSKTAGAPTIMPRDMSDYDAAPQAEKDAYNNFVSQGAADSDSGWYVPLSFSSWRRSYWDDTKGDTTYAPGMPPMAGSRKNADAAFEPNNPEFMAGFRAGSADARTQPTVNSPGTGMVPYGSSIPEGASDKFRKGYASGYQSATDVHMGSRRTAAEIEVFQVENGDWNYSINGVVSQGNPFEDRSHAQRVAEAELEEILDARKTFYPNVRPEGSRRTADFPGTTCDLCGFTPKNSRDLYYSAMGQQTQCVNGAACLKRREKKGSRKTGEKYRAEVAGINEGTWSNNALEYDTIEEAQAWLSDLSMRWFGYDMGRVVPVSTPRNEVVDPSGDIFQNFRSGSRRTAGGSGKYECQVCGLGFFNSNEFKINCPRCGSIEVKDVGNPYGMANWGVKTAAFDPARSKTRVIQEPLSGKWQAQYFDSVVGVWGDLGDAVDTQVQALEKIQGEIAKRMNEITGSRKTAFSPTHQCFDPSSPTGFVQCELVEGDPRGPEGTFVTVRREDGSTTSELGEMVIPLKEGSRKTAYYSIEWSGGFGTDSGYSSEAEAVRTAIENGDPEAGIFYNEASGDSYLGKAQALADELDLEEFNFQAHVQGSGSRGSARRHPFGRRVGIGGPDAGYGPSGQTEDPTMGRRDMQTPCRVCGDLIWPAEQWENGYVHVDGRGRDHNAFPAHDVFPFETRKTAAAILDEDPENNTMTTEQGVWTMEYDSESMKRMKSADDYEPWFPEFPGEQNFTQPHHYKLVGPKGQVHEFSAQGDSVVSPWYAAWEQARNIVQQASRKTATTFLVKHDFSQSQPAVNWAKSDYGRRYGPNNEGFTVEADSEEEVKQILRSQHNLNPTFVTITRQEIPGQEKLTASKTAQAGPPEPWPESACGEQDEDTFCIRDTDHEGDHQFRSRFWIENKMDEAGLTSIEEELPEEGEEQAEEVPPEGEEVPPKEEAPAEKKPEEKKKGEVPPQFKKKTSRPKADLSRVAEDEQRICQDCGYPLNEPTPAAHCNKHPAPRAGMRKVTAFVLGEPEDWEDRVHYRMVARGIGRNTPHSQRTTHLLERAKQWATREGAEGWKAANDFVYGSYEILEVGVDAEPFLNANREYLKPRAGMLKGAPFADYKDFADCTSKNSDKDDPEAYCGYIKHKVEDTKESILIASALLPRLTNADFEQATAELSGEKQWV